MKLAIALLLCMCPTLDAQEILAQDIFSGSLYSVDPKTGENTYIATPPSAAGNYWGPLAMDSQGLLYAANGDSSYGTDVYIIDSNTAQTTWVAYVAINGFSCMAFDDNDTLYFMNKRWAPLAQSPWDLHTLDLATGIHTLIGDTGTGTGNDMIAMDFHDGALFVHPIHFSSSLGLSTVDISTGLVTDINPSFSGIPPGGIAAFCFDDQGTLYYLDSFLWTMDPESTTASLVDWVSPFQWWGECVFLEGPTPNFSLTLSGFTGGPMKVKLAGATPFGQVAILSALGPGGPTTIPAGFPCAGVELALNPNIRLLGIGTADQDGYLELGPDPMPAAALHSLRIQAVDMTSCAVTNRTIVSF